MKIQTNREKPETIISVDDTRPTEVLHDYSETERTRTELLATITHDGFKDALTMCSVNMMETGKANAFAIYKNVDRIQISDPVLADPESACRFGMDPTKCVWHEETKIDELLRDDSPKKQQILYEFDEKSKAVVPRKDVWACVMGFPMGGMEGRGLHATDLQRPTKAWLDFYLQQEQLHSGFIGGILTNDGKKSGLILFKKSEQIQEIDSNEWRGVGVGDAISRDYIFPQMAASGMVYADIDLTWPKNRDPDKLYKKRVSQAVNALF